MNIKKTVKYLLSEKNPVVNYRREKMRKALFNTTPSFLCPNCIGGILFHDLGLQFRSPTVNLMLFQTDFVKFVLNTKFYLAQKLVFFEHPEYNFPCAYLHDIILHFTHYHSKEEAAQKWEERSARINWDNLFIFLEERDGLTQKEMLQLSNIRARGLVIFTANAYPNIPYALQLPKYAHSGEVGNILAKSYWDGSHEYEMFFDFVKWFNEADGNFDISPFIEGR